MMKDTLTGRDITYNQWASIPYNLFITTSKDIVRDVILYRRVSTQEQGNSRNGLDSQQQALDWFCQRENLNVIGSYCDIASGKHGKESSRLDLQKALAECRRTKALLLVSKLDRLSRSVQFIATLMNSSVEFATAEDGLQCSPFMLHLKASFAEEERNRISERTKSALAAKKARGEALGSHTHKDRQTTKEKAKANLRAVVCPAADEWAIRMAPRIRRMVDQGMTYQQVADELNALGVPTRGNGRWHAPTISNLLKRSGIAQRHVL